jgi:hypothetical protein
VLVHDPALVGAHVLHLDRAALADGVLGGHVGLALQGLALAVAVAGGVNADPLAVRPPLEGDLVAEQLHGVDRLPMAPDQQPDVLTVDGPANLILVLIDGDIGLEPKLVNDALEQNTHALDRLIRQSLHGSLGSLAHGPQSIRRIQPLGVGTAVIPLTAESRCRRPGRRLP